VSSSKKLPQGNGRSRNPIFSSQEKWIGRAVAQFRALDSDPMLMGRSAGAYDALRIYPSTLVEVMKDTRKATRKGQS